MADERELNDTEMDEIQAVADMDALNEQKQNPYRPGTPEFAFYDYAHKMAWNKHHH